MATRILLNKLGGCWKGIEKEGVSATPSLCLYFTWRVLEGWKEHYEHSLNTLLVLGSCDLGPMPSNR